VKLTWISGKQAFADPLSIFRYPLSIIDNDKSPVPYGIRLHGRKQKRAGDSLARFCRQNRMFLQLPGVYLHCPQPVPLPDILIKTA
jgi:hypothetical protein